MKARSLVYCILLSTLVILLLSTAVQATEYKDIDAKKILKQIENGEDVSYIGYRIKGELNVSGTKLETAPNPCFNKLLNEGYNKEEIIDFGFNENSSVIETNITIKNSTFENDLNFSNVQCYNSVDFGGTKFNNSVDFGGTKFNNSANFDGANFNNFTGFTGTIFNDSANFTGANFGNSTYFTQAKFNDYANFDETIFGDSVHFNSAKFNDTTDFEWAKFNDSADFTGANFGPTSFCEANFGNSANFDSTTFSDYAYFGQANFGNSTNFYGTTFNGSTYFDQANFGNSANFKKVKFNDFAKFVGPETSENIITDGKTCELFRTFYKNNAQYEDADNIYYNFRKYSQGEKSLTSFPKWMDFLSWATCGYGLRISHTIWCGVVVILFFAYVYNRQSTTVSVVGIKNKVEPIRVYWKESGIYRLSDEAEKKSPVSLWECLYFSINIFTRLGSSDWRAREELRKWVAVEGLLGWVMLGIFMATLTNLLMRS